MHKLYHKQKICATLKIGLDIQDETRVNGTDRQSMFVIREVAMMNIRVILVIATLGVLLAAGCSVGTNEGRFDQGKENFIAGNFDQSFKQLHPLAKQGNPEAQYAVGYMYFYGLGTKQNVQEAVDWMQRAAESGQPQAQLALKQLQQDQLVTARAFSSSGQGRTYSGGQSSSRGRSGGANRSADIPNQLTATWPQSSAGAPVETSPTSSVPSSALDGTSDLHSSAVLLPSMQTDEKVAQATDNRQEQHASNATPPAGDVIKRAGHFSIQLMGAYFPKELDDFSKKLSLPADQYQIVQTKRDGRDWFVLAYGDYPTLSAALKARKDLPKELQVLKPWVRNMRQFGDTTEQRMFA